MNKSINKKSMRVVALLTVLSHGNAVADCIKPIYSGENLWKLVARIGECLDDGLQEIESKVDAIECAFVPCENIITQADIPYVITQPGTYCLGESVSYMGAPFFVLVVSNDVVLDLGGYQIDGGTEGGLAEGAQGGVAVIPGAKNITIKNGTISNCAQSGINVGAFLGDEVPIQTLTSCVTLEDLRVLDVSTYLPSLSNTEQLDLIGSTLDSLSAVPGFDPVLECCLADPLERVRPAVGIIVGYAQHVAINNCQVFRAEGDGIYLLQVQDAWVKNSQAYNNGGNGFVFDNGDVSSVVSCKAEQNGQNGFYEVACNGDNSYKKCIAKQNGVHGFRIIGSGKTVEECIANQNTLDGFFVVTPNNSLVDGSLDITFGTDGKVLTDFSGGGSNDIANAAVLQKDGTIVAGGFSDVSGSAEFALAFYNTHGTLLNTVTTGFGGVSAAAQGLAIQEDGKIVAAGNTISAGSDFALARYNPDGSLDTAGFGVLGKVITDFSGTGTSSDQANAVAIQQDGKIVAAGFSNNSGTNAFALARYETDGSLDMSFGASGKVETDFGGTDDQAFAIALQEDGKIVVAGKAGDDIALARYNMDGSLDMSFGINGKVVTDLGATVDQANAVAIQKNGKIVVAGISDASGFADFALVRYNSDGSVDITATTDLSGDNTSFASGEGVIIQKDGKMIVAGLTSVGIGDNDFALARYNTDGSLDAASFNPSGTLAIVPGTVTTSFGDIDNSNALVLQPDGKIVAVGTSSASGSSDFALARYNIFKRPSVIQDSIAMENGRDGFNIIDAYKMTLVNNVAAANACNGFIGGTPAESALDVIVKNVGDNNTCADYSNIDAEIVSASAGEWVNIKL
jgi:uncharacterized delta-60 repeat protein